VAVAQVPVVRAVLVDPAVQEELVVVQVPAAQEDPVVPVAQQVPAAQVVPVVTAAVAAVAAVVQASTVRV
jgi:hypothetical protein